jgi:hypothetical protein
MVGILKVDTIQNANADNIITQTNSTTLTIGASGDTVTLAAGATSSGFGATYNGAVNWDTTVKTTGFTAVSGNGYFVNTTSGAITVTLPATPSAGAIVAIADYANTSATNNITVGRNGSNLDGGTIDAKISINGQVYTLIYVDSTEGWKTVSQTYNQISTAAYVTATGGTITTCGNFKIHSFTGPGTFTVTCAGNPLGSTTVDYLVIAGGGGGSADGGQPQGGAGGGAGGFRQSFPNPATGGFPITAIAYPITVGAGGAGSAGRGCKGSNSVFSTITSTGGGQGGVYSGNAGEPGGSGGGGGANTGAGGTGNTPPVSPSQGNPGSPAVDSGTPGAGGGATSAGSGQNGGSGTTSTISGSPIIRGGGGASGTGGSAGPGGGGATATAGTANTGGGGGGNNNPSGGKAGGSGLVIIRYKYQ